MDHIKLMAYQLILATIELHDAQYVHAEINPKNVWHVDFTLKTVQKASKMSIFGVSCYFMLRNRPKSCGRTQKEKKIGCKISQTIRIWSQKLSILHKKIWKMHKILKLYLFTYLVYYFALL